MKKRTSYHNAKKIFEENYHLRPLKRHNPNHTHKLVKTHLLKGETHGNSSGNAKEHLHNLVIDKELMKLNPFHDKKVREYPDTRYQESHLIDMVQITPDEAKTLKIN